MLKDRFTSCLAFCPRLPYCFTESACLSCILALPACTSRRHSGRPFWERQPLCLMGYWAVASSCFWDFVVLQNEEKRLQTSRIWFLLASQQKWLHFAISANALPSLSSFSFAWKQSHVLKNSGPVYSRGESLPHCPLPSHCWHSICSECWSGYLHYLE